VAQVNLGLLLLRGQGTARNPAAAAAWIRAAAEQGLPQALIQLGALYETGKGVERDPFEAWRCYRRAALAGSAEGAQRALRLADRADESLRLRMTADPELWPGDQGPESMHSGDEDEQTFDPGP
jgi:TPR repeat protein